MLSMKVNGINNQEKDTEEVIKSGVMVVSTKDIGKMIKPMEKEDLFTQMEISMTDTGKMIKPTDSVVTLILMEQSIKDIGKMISNMVRVKNNGQTVLNTLEATSTERKMVSVNSFGQINLHMMVNLLITIFTAKESTDGQTEENTSETGLIIKFMVKVSSHGLIDVNMRESTMMIRSRVMEFLPGQMEGNTMDNGSMESKKVSESITTQREN